MTIARFDFYKQLDDSEQFDARLDEFFSEWFFIQKADRYLQRHEIDRIFTTKNSRLEFTVEYKNDKRAADTNNAYIETVSVDNANILGWAYTSWAQILMIYSPYTGKIFVLPMWAIKKNLSVWLEAFRPSKPVPNSKNGNLYNTRGIPVPLVELRKYCFKEFSIEPLVRPVA